MIVLPSASQIINEAYKAFPVKKNVGIGAATVAMATAGYLTYTGKLTPMAIAAGQKVSEFASGAYALGCKGYVAAAPYAAASYAKAAALANYSITVLTPYAAAASAKAAPYTAMIGMTPVTLSIALGAAGALVVVIMVCRTIDTKKLLTEVQRKMIANACQIWKKKNPLEMTVQIQVDGKIVSRTITLSEEEHQLIENMPLKPSPATPRNHDTDRNLDVADASKFDKRKSQEVKALSREISTHIKKPADSGAGVGEYEG